VADGVPIALCCYLQEQLPNIQLKGASLLALTPELPDRSISTTEKHQLQFEVLSDVETK
jgi:peroxiredoxin